MKTSIYYYLCKCAELTEKEKADIDYINELSKQRARVLGGIDYLNNLPATDDRFKSTSRKQLYNGLSDANDDLVSILRAARNSRIQLSNTPSKRRVKNTPEERLQRHILRINRILEHRYQTQLENNRRNGMTPEIFSPLVANAIGAETQQHLRKKLTSHGIKPELVTQIINGLSPEFRTPGTTFANQKIGPNMAELARQAALQKAETGARNQTPPQEPAKPEQQQPEPAKPSASQTSAKPEVKPEEKEKEKGKGWGGTIGAVAGGAAGFGAGHYLGNAILGEKKDDESTGKNLLRHALRLGGAAAGGYGGYKLMPKKGSYNVMTDATRRALKYYIDTMNNY